MNKEQLSLKISGVPIDAPPGLPTGGANTAANIVSVALGAMIAFGIISSLMFLIWGGISWITSGGDKQKVDKARKTIVWAIIGIFILALSFLLFNFIGTVLGGIFTTSPPTNPGAGSVR